MGSQYSLSTFLRQTPNHLLERYFHARGVLHEVRFDLLRKTQFEPILLGLETLPIEVRVPIERELQDIFLLADKAGTQIILDAAALHGLDLADAIEAMDNHYHRAMWLFLHRHQQGVDLYETCRTLAQMKSVSFTNAKRRKDLPRCEPKYNAETRAEMAQALRAAYRPQGRGHKCVVEHFFRPNPDRHCYFAYPEDHSTSELEYDGEDLLRRARKSVFQVAFLYRPDEGVLEIDAPGGKRDTNILHEIFCRYALGMDRLVPRTNDQCFDLGGLKRRDFAFPTDPADGIEKVEVVALRLHQVGNRRRRITVEHDPTQAESLYDWMDLALDESKIPRRMMDVSQARLRVTWKVARGRARTLTFTLTMPDSSSLKDLPSHLMIRRYLKVWMIAP